MAQSRESKEKDLVELTELFASSKLTVAATYSGLSVLQLQELRRVAAENGTTIRVAKNRLVKRAVSKNEQLKSADVADLKGQLLYAFSDTDELAPAQVLHNFAKANQQLEFVAGINAEGEVFNSEQVNALATLPTKDQLRAQLVGTLAAPLSGLVTVLSGNLTGLMNVLNARKEQLESN